MSVFTTWTAAWGRKTPAFSKKKAAIQTMDRQDMKFLILNRKGTGYMVQMIINQLFADSQGLGEISGAHLPVGQQFNHRLSNCFLKKSVFVLNHILFKTHFIRTKTKTRDI